MTMFQVGGMFHTKIAVHVDGEYRFTARFRWVSCQWEDDTPWTLNLNIGQLCEKVFGQVVLHPKSC